MARLRPRAARGQVVVLLWFLLLALLAATAVVWVTGEIAARHARENLDTRLSGSLRVARQDFAEALSEARIHAESLARSVRLQRVLAEGDRAAARRIASDEPALALYSRGKLLAGSDQGPARRSVSVLNERGGILGRVVVSIPLDDTLARRLARTAGLDAGSAATIASGSHIVAASDDVHGTLPSGDSGSTHLGGEGYRFLSTPLLEGTGLRLVALSSTDPVADAASDTRRRALVAALATIGLIALLVWTATRLPRRREPASEPAVPDGDRRRGGARGGRRVRDAVALVGEALAATHDPEALLPVILQSAIEATGAAGARVVSGGSEVVRAGDPGAGGRPLTLRLGTDDDVVGRLLLYPPAGGSFGRDEVQLANWLAAQASIALENERLHRTVKRQAITDELTQLANRRRFTETLSLEVRRAERFGDPLTLVLADLDDFKQINDRYGHQVGDEVLRRFADVLRANVRDFDLPVRFGGEEFAVLLPETGLDGGEQLAHRLATALARLEMPEVADRPPVTASFGVASFPAAATSEEILTSADRALYEAKAQGKNRVITAVPDPSRTD